jgi:HPt (histidine-containing phosphotransfer) domain-containing protein
VQSLCDPGFDYRRALGEADPKMMFSTAAALLQQSVELLPALHRSVLANAPDEVQRAALTLKDMLLSLGAIPAARLTLVIAAQARSGQLDKVEGKLGDLEAECSLLLPLLKETVAATPCPVE